MSEKKTNHSTKKFFLWKLSKDILVVVWFVFFWGVIGGGLAFGYLYAYAAPSVNALSAKPLSQTSIIYDRTGEHVLYQIYGEENRKIITHEQIPDTIRIATIAAEDDAFYRHFGVDPKGVLRALKINVQESSIQQGGSTITMQLVKNVFLTNERTLERKVAEAVLAVKLEQAYDKDEILNWYLNVVPYGYNTYGVQTAAEVFFGKEAIDLTLDEAALLAALPKATSYYSPSNSNVSELKARQEKILRRIGELQLASQQQVERALQTNTFAKLNEREDAIQAPHFVFYVLEQLEKEYGRDLLEKGGLRVRTTLDYDLQQLAQQTVEEGSNRNSIRYRAENAALTAVDPKTGEILAMAGSRDYFDENIDGQVNVATRPRQPGSAFKPFAYAAAFEKGFQPETVLFDVRTNFGPDGSGRDYIPRNYDGQFRGLVSMRQALAMSLNVPAVKTLYVAGVDYTIDLAHRLGISTLNERNRYGLSLVLGGGEITLLDGTAAFSVFANDGIRHPATAISEITGPDGSVIESEEKKSERVLDAQVARKINSVLSDNQARTPTFGPSSPLYIPGEVVAAKTGTTQEYRDAWTIGYTPSLAVGVWAGNNDNRPMAPGAAGVFAAAPIWNSFMRQVIDQYPYKPFIGYERENTNKAMVTGNFEKKVLYYDKNSGKKLTENTAKKRDSDEVRQKIEAEQHSLLYYIDPSNPLGDGEIDFSDPMLQRWEEALNNDDIAVTAPVE